jgi:uncharacterized protein (DUF2141 family)
MVASKRIWSCAAVTMILASASGLNAGEPTTASTALKVRIDSLRSARGKVLAYVWDQGDGFPADKKKTLTTAAVEIRGTEAVCDFAVREAVGRVRHAR